MREFMLIIAFLSGGLTLLGIYFVLEYSQGAGKSAIERSNAMINAVKDDGVPPHLIYWVNVYYLKLIDNFRFLLGISGGIFLISLVVLHFL